MAKGACTVVVLVPHPSRPAMLTLVAPAWTDGAAQPPTLTIARDFKVRDCLTAIEALLGVVPVPLRMDTRRVDADGDPLVVVVDLAAIGPDAPSPFEWTDWAAVPLETLEPPELREALPRWIGRRQLGNTTADQPWSMPGWFERASTWMVERMAELHAPAFEAPRVVYLWGISAVLRAPSALGPMFFKCSASPIFEREATVTAALSEATPELVTRVAAIEPRENWLLMYDHGERTLGDDPPETWGTGLEVHARIQQAWTGREAALHAAGAPIRSLRDLAMAVPTLADQEPMETELTGEHRAAWKASIGALTDACARLDALGPPPGLVHGDLHPWNVAATPDGPRIFDWTDTAISHPFVDLGVYATRPDDVRLRRTLRDAYLARWTEHLPAADLSEAGDLAITVGALFQVQSYVRILSSLDPDDRGDLSGAAGSWARAAVATLTDGIDLRRPGHADG